MKYWILLPTKYSFSENEYILNKSLKSLPNTGEISFQNRNTGKSIPEPGDKIVHLINPSLEEPYFKEISEVADVTLTPKTEDQLVIRLNRKILLEKSPLSAFRYSLLLTHKIDEYSSLNRLINTSLFKKNPWIKITETEFKAIESRTFFIQRTVVAYLFNTLHKDHKISFQKLLFSRFGLYFDKNGYDYFKVYPLLKQYIQNNLIENINLLSLTNEYLSEFVDKEIINEIGFGFDNSNTKILISDHYSFNIGYNIILKWDEFIKKVDASVNQSNLERDFNIVFRKSPLPFKLILNEY